MGWVGPGPTEASCRLCCKKVIHRLKASARLFWILRLLIQPNSTSTIRCRSNSLIGPYVHPCIGSYISLLFSLRTLLRHLRAWYDTRHVHLHACLHLVFFFSSVHGLTSHMPTFMHVCSSFSFFLYVRACSFFSRTYMMAPVVTPLLFFSSSFFWFFLLFIFLPTCLYNFFYNNFIDSFSST